MRRTKHNPERKAWKGFSYKKSKGSKRTRVRDLRDRDSRLH